jgi:glycolate oxidase FAD binding subunit
MEEEVLALQQKIKSSESLHISSGESGTSVLGMENYSGVVKYHPEELVITLKAGTSINETQELLKNNNQALPFFVVEGVKSVGSAYAQGGANFSDYVLGVQVITGEGDILNFGGQVMKNVAGYDVSRLLVGSMGKVALITQVSLKVLPKTYVDKMTLSKKLKSATSQLHKDIENKLKEVFDPRGIFI